MTLDELIERAPKGCSHGKPWAVPCVECDIQLWDDMIASYKKVLAKNRDLLATLRASQYRKG